MNIYVIPCLILDLVSLSQGFQQLLMQQMHIGLSPGWLALWDSFTHRFALQMGEHLMLPLCCECSRLLSCWYIRLLNPQLLYPAMFIIMVYLIFL
jgi:hypothetical protein